MQYASMRPQRAAGIRGCSTRSAGADTRQADTDVSVITSFLAEITGNEGTPSL